MHAGAKLAVVVVLVASGGALAFAGAAPEGYATVGDVWRDPAAFEAREFELKATVVEGSLDRGASPVTFRVTDGVFDLAVAWDPAAPLPDHEAGGTIEGRSVVVHGTLARTHEGDLVIHAHDMQVGCASKYRAA